MKKSVIAIAIAVLVICGIIGMTFFRKVAPPTPHSVSLTWHPPAPGPGTIPVSYSVYRSTTLNGPYVKIASGLKTLSYNDALMAGSRTYYYVVTSVDAKGRESRYSSEIRVDIP